MKFLYPILLCMSGIFSVTASPAWMQDSKPEYVIAVPSAPLPAEQKAAAELAQYLSRITGVTFSVVTEEKTAPGQKAVYVGQTAYAEKNGIDFKRLDQEEWIIRSMPDSNLILTGGKLRGILYAVYDYLERQCGVRWLDETVEAVPSNPMLEVGKWNLQRKPYFGNRWIYDRLDWFPAAGRFKEHNKGFSYSQADNGMARLIGGQRPHHTFFDYCSSWPKDKKELFSRNAAGEAVIPTSGEGPGQICMTSPEARKRVLAQLREFIRKDRAEAAEKGYPAPLIYDISQNDNNQYCVCPGCKAIAEKEGSQAGPLMDFINHIAKEIHKEYPEILIRTFAYQYSVQPPRTMKTEKNVIIHLAQVGIEFGGGYYTYDTLRALNHPLNNETRELVKQWAAHTNHIARWDYWTLYPLYPEPHVRVNAVIRDIPFYKDNHVSYLFAEYENPHWNNFFPLTRYLGYKLMDDPDLDAEAVTGMFLKHYYGVAADTMRQLLDYIQKRQDGFNDRIAGIDLSRREYLDDEFFATAFRLLDQAEREAGRDENIIKRIRRERPPLLAGLLMRWKSLNNPAEHYDHKALMQEFRKETLASLSYYFPDDRNGFKSEILRELEKCEQRFAANAILDTLPSEIGTVTGDVLDLNAGNFLQEGMQAKLIDDPAAFHGKAMSLNWENAGSATVVTDNWMDGGRLAALTLDEKVLPSDGKYHWIKLGRISFPNNGRVHMYVPNLTGIRCEFYRLVRPGTKYALFLSAKRVGNTLSMDRLILKEKK